MKILHINTLGYGGAAVAAQRLHEGLLGLGHASRVLVQKPAAGAAPVHTMMLDTSAYPSLSDPTLEAFFDNVAQSCKAPGVDVLFSADGPTRDLALHPAVREADVINLHWVAWLLSARAVAAIQALGKPVVWTLHDQFPFTGGCHYSGSCTNYERDCEACPLVRDDVQVIPRLLLARKKGAIDGSRLVVVSPSEWLAGIAGRSAVLGSADIRVIPNSVPVAAFQSQSREAARRMLGLPDSAVILLFGADSLGEARKGYGHLQEALTRLSTDPVVGPRIADGSIQCVSFGKGRPAREAVPVRHLGSLSGERLTAAYRAADAFVLPTLEDNLPNTMLEAVAAGTPVVAYATGGVPDVVERHGCGILAEPGNVAALADAMRTILLDESLRDRLRPLCEAVARERFQPNVQAEAYARLYRDLLGRNVTAVASPRVDPVDHLSEDANTFALVVGTPGLAMAPLAAFREELAAHQAALATDGSASAAPDGAALAATRAKLTTLEGRVAELERLGVDLLHAGPRVKDERLLPDAGGAFEWLVRSRVTGTPSSPLTGPGAPGVVSVIVPVFNTAAYLEQAIRSVWTQTLESDRIQIVVVDDGSTDGSYELACRLQSESPVGMEVLTHPNRQNRGVSATRNLALAHATGEFIALLDADDAYLPERLASGVTYLDEHAECSVVCSLGDYVDGTGRAICGPNGSETAGEYRHWTGLQPPFTFEQLWNLYPVANSSLLIRREALAAVGGYPEEMAHQAEDRLLVLKLSLASPVHCLHDRLILYRHHATNYTSQYMTHGFEEGVRLELLYHLVFWMTSERPEWRAQGLTLFRRNYPALFAQSPRANTSRDELLDRICREVGLDVEAFLAARARDRAELDVLRRVTPGALRDARDARAEVERLRGQLARLRQETLCV